jgi:crotonobetainyl-CoA:carnitine CoA-transferase CaiB-like acyl-CoA transferase
MPRDAVEVKLPALGDRRFPELPHRVRHPPRSSMERPSRLDHLRTINSASIASNVVANARGLLGAIRTEVRWNISVRSAGRPLHGVRVLDVSRILAGPHCAMILGDLGADVIKVEPPQGDETRRWGPPFFGQSAAYYFAANRNKRNVVVDLKSEGGRAELNSLLTLADVVVQNFTAEHAAAYGVDADSVEIVNPKAVHVTISGFGPSQPTRRGYDLLAQALGGIMSVTGQPGGRGVKVGVPIADLTAGTYAATAALAALVARGTTGHGARIEVSLVEAVTALLANQAMNWLLCGSLPGPLGNDHPNVVPYGVFRTATGDVVIAVASDGQYLALCKAIGRSDLAEDIRFTTNAERVTNREALTHALDAHLSTQPAEDWVQSLAAAGIPCGTVRSVAEALISSDAGNVATVEHPQLGAIRQVLSPIQIDGRHLDAYLAPPEPDEHRTELLAR